MPKPLIIILLVSCYLPVAGQPTALFSADKTGGCGPLIIHFTNQSTGIGAAVSYQWDLGNGNSSVVADPVATYTQPGSYTVVLTVQDGGQTSTASQVVTVYQPPTASFTVADPRVCSPTPVQFNATATPGSGAISSYLWDFGDGNTGSVTGSSAAHVYNAGIYTVNLTVSNTYGCVATVAQSDVVTVLPALLPSFTVDPQVLCAVNSPVTFTNTTTGPGPLSYQWNFGDGNSSTVANPSYTYSAKGTYTVILTATSPAGCVAADTQTNVLNVANFQTNFTVPASVCQGAPEVFTDSSSPSPSAVSWVVDGVAAGTGITLSNSFSTTGNHTITLTNSYGVCMQSVTRSFAVNPAPVMPPFDAVQQSACGAPVTVNFLDHTPGAVAWAWVFEYESYIQFPNITTGGPANSTIYGENGEYQVQLTVTNAQGCQASELQYLGVTSPYADIVVTAGTPSVCGQPMTETFGSANIPNLASWEWIFGDGDSTNAPSPTHTFTNPGNYQTFLRWTDKNGCSGVSNVLFTTITAPFANVNFTADATTVCPGQTVNFGGLSANNDSAAIISWDFGDGTSAFGADYSSHVYSTPGVYSVTLNLASAGQCISTDVKTNYITVLPAPTITLSEQQTCDSPRANVTFTVAAGNGATGIQWNFGDGTIQNTGPDITSLVHTYTETEGFMISATATNGTCTASAGVGVNIWLKPLSFTLDLSAASICPSANLYEEIHATEPPGGELNSWGDGGIQWFYGDGTPFQGTNTTSPFNPNSAFYNSNMTGFKPGESGLWAITTNLQGCKDTTNIAPLVIGGVTAAYQIIQDDQCYELPVILQDMSQAPPGDPIVSWLWDFGDGITSTASGTVQHLYAAPGTYTVTLTVTDQNGCASASQQAVNQVTVNGPKAIFETQGGALTFPQGSTVQFVNNSNTTNTTSPAYSWNFGDMSTSNFVNPAHTYAVPGVYTVTLTAWDAAGGCLSTASLVITIQPVNNAFSTAASYVASGSCPPVLVQFTNTSVNYISYTWNFGDGETVSNVPDPSHVYQKPGSYIVTLTVFGDNGQTTTTVDSVVVVQPTAVLSTAAPAICQGQSVTLQSTGNQRVKSYNWDFGDGTVVSDTDSTISHVYATAGTYQARLVVADSLGCNAAAAAGDAIDVHAPPIVGLTPPDPLVCLGKGVAIKAIGGVTYSWSPGASLSDSTIAAPVASPGVNTIYTVTVADNIGCTGSDSIRVRVVQPETVQVSPDSTAICPGKNVPITATGAYSYNWIGSGLNAANISNPVASPSVSTVYRVAGSDSAGCFSDTVSVIVTVLPVPTVNAGPEIDVLAETPVTIPAVGSSDVVLWQWTPSIDLSCTTCAQPVCTPRQTQQYIVTVTAADGCIASDSVVVKLLCDEAKVRIPDAFTPNGDGHNDRFTILGAISVVNHMAIYDRWGVKVFEADHFAPAAPGAGWDGTMHGQQAPPGVYVYYAEMQCPGGGVFIMKGTVVLIR
jgi:gliding motility-associated-like protein